MIMQRTLNEAISVSGIGLHSGRKVAVTFRPAPAGTGIIYTRTDLQPQVTIAASPECVRDTQLCTALVNADGVRIATVEHLTAALSAFGIDNLYIDVDAPELPVMDGSAHPFVYLFDRAGVRMLDAPKKFYAVRRQVRVEDGDKYAELLPGSGGFHLDLTIDFRHPAIEQRDQHFAFTFSGRGFASELSRARTFCFMRDVEYMHAHNLALGGSLENAVVFDDTRVMNPGGLRYPNELVKHKMLDAIGDLYMAGHSLLGEFRAHKTGHTLNNRLLRALLADPANYEAVTQGTQREAELEFMAGTAPAGALPAL